MLPPQTLQVSMSILNSVVAEGVETHVQLTVLQGLQCDVAQGYYFGRPVPASRLTELLLSQNQKSQSGDVIDIANRPGYTSKNTLPPGK